MDVLTFEFDMARRALEFLPFPGWVKSVGGAVITTNAAWEMHFLPGKPLPDDPLDVLDPDRREASDQRDAEVVATGTWHSWKDPDGLVVKWPIRKGGEIIAVAGVLVRDQDLSTFRRCFVA